METVLIFSCKKGKKRYLAAVTKNGRLQLISNPPVCLILLILAREFNIFLDFFIEHSEKTYLSESFVPF